MWLVQKIILIGGQAQARRHATILALARDMQYVMTTNSNYWPRICNVTQPSIPTLAKDMQCNMTMFDAHNCSIFLPWVLPLHVLIGPWRATIPCVSSAWRGSSGVHFHPFLRVLGYTSWMSWHLLGIDSSPRCKHLFKTKQNKCQSSSHIHYFLFVFSKMQG